MYNEVKLIEYKCNREDPIESIVLIEVISSLIINYMQTKVEIKVASNIISVLQEFEFH